MVTKKYRCLYCGKDYDDYNKALNCTQKCVQIELPEEVEVCDKCGEDSEDCECEN